MHTLSQFFSGTYLHTDAISLFLTDTHTNTHRWHWHMAQCGGSLGNRKLPSQEGPGQLRTWPYWMSSVNLGSPSFTPSKPPPPSPLNFPAVVEGVGICVSQRWANTCQGKVDCLLRIMCLRQVANVPPPFSLSLTPWGTLRWKEKERGRINCIAVIRRGLGWVEWSKGGQTERGVERGQRVCLIS